MLEELEKIPKVRDRARTIAKGLIEGDIDASVFLCDWCNSLRGDLDLLKDIARILGIKEIRVSKDQVIVMRED